MYITIN